MAEEKYVPRLKTKYKDKVRAKLVKQFGYTNPMTVPQIEKIVVNMGVGEGFSKQLELTGVGYRVALKGKNLDLSLGYSHPVIFEAPHDISFECPDNTHIIVKGISKEQVGQVAAEIRMKRPPEPYKGKGIHYMGEHIRRKLGKAAK